MNPVDETIIRKAKLWISHAEEDLRLAQHGLKLKSSCPYKLIAYHAQQCAEKYLKAFLVYQNIDFPYTHNISRLLELCADKANWTEKLKDAEELTPFAITTRYPGEYEEVTKENAMRAIRIAKFVRRTVRAALTQAGITINNKAD
ncbi:MAG: HEPN domain-containing protein [candidate division KSB1 bacterium]|nr:HEPN domain-containing protein [candidate division KSB1 bacterium]MDZ7341387.1 HEPN domain-containing protein [candidate division KSB1 bacterium]